MERKSPKCPHIVDPNQFGCEWKFSGMFDHHRGQPNRKLLSDESHGSKRLTGAGHSNSQARLPGFDEQLKGINIESKRKTVRLDSREKDVKKITEEISSSRDLSQMSMDIHPYDEGFCSRIPRINAKDSRFDKTKKTHNQFDEKNLQLVQLRAKKFRDQIFVDEENLKTDGSKSNRESRHFSDALETLKSNQELLLRILHDPNSRYEHKNNKKNSNSVDKIVVLKPGQQTAQTPVDVGCHCSYLQRHHRPISQQKSNTQIVKHTRFSFRDVTKKLRNARKLKNTKEESQSQSSSKASKVFRSDVVDFDESQTSRLSVVPYAKQQELDIFVEAKRRIDERFRQSSSKASKVLRSEVVDFDESQTSRLSIIPYAKQQELDVFVEAKRRIAERFRQVAKGEASSSQRAPRTLEKILLSSPKHESMANFTAKCDGTHMRLSVSQAHEENQWSGSSPTKQNEDSSSNGYVEITDSNSNVFNMASKHNIDAKDEDGCFQELRVEFSRDVSSTKDECICKLEAMDNDRYSGENPSPVSVLESLFVDNVSSPTSTSESAVEHQIQPRRLDFEEHSQTSSPPHQNATSRTFMDDKRIISSYIKTIYQTSQSNWEDFLINEYPEEYSSCDHKLLYDCIKEVLIDLHQYYFDFSPWVAFLKSKIQPFSSEENVVNEVMEKVDWHNCQPSNPRTLDQIVGKDIAKSGKWVDVRLSSQDIVFEFVDEALQGLIMEAIVDFQF